MPRGYKPDSQNFCWALVHVTLCVCACMHAHMLSQSLVSDSLQPHELLPARFLCPWNYPVPVYWSRLSFPTPRDLPDPEIQLVSLCLLHW